jgi:5'-deoxynucleotidase YfbR-like HD superfamily hydrolase
MKRIAIWSICVMLTITTHAQERQKKVDIEAIIVAFITKKMNLTADEAQEFWPVFNNYRTEHKATIKETDEIKKNETIVVIQKKYKPQFQKILKSEARANQTFKVHMELLQRLKQFSERRKANMQRRNKTT